MHHSIPLLIITGPVGVGKTSVAFALSETLDRAGVAHAFVDMDGLTRFFPRPEDDPFIPDLAIRNLAAVWKNFHEAGATCLIVADVIESIADLDRFQSAVAGARILLVRLVASRATIADRLTERETGTSLEWHLCRADELAQQMHETGLEDVLVDTDGKCAREVANEIRDRCRWPSGVI